MVAWGVYLRLYSLGATSYWMDEGYTALAIETMLTTGRTTLPGGMSYFCGLYCFGTLPFAYMLDMSPISMRILAVFASVAAILVSYRLSRVLFTRSTAMITVVMTSLSYWQIAWARQARWYSLLELFVVLTLYTYALALTTRNRLYALLAVMFSLCALLTHSSALLLPVAIFVHFVILSVRNKSQFVGKISRTSTIVYFVALPLLLISLYGVYSFAQSFTHLNLFSYYASFYGTRYFLYIVLAILGVCFALRLKTHRSGVLLLLSVVSAYVIGLSFFTDILHYRYLFLVTPCIYILAAYGLASLYECARSTKHALNRYACIALLCGVGALYATLNPQSGGATVLPASFYALESDSADKTTNTNYFAYTPQPDWQEAYQSIIRSSTSDSIVISSHPHFTYLYTHRPGYWIPVDYIDTDSTSTKPGVDPYVGALPIATVDELVDIITSRHGFIVFDYQASNGRIPEDMLRYIANNLTLVYTKNTNNYSRIWVYSF